MEHGCAPPSTRRGLTGWNGTQALEGLAVSKCAPATNGCAPAAPGLLTFCCNCFTVTPQNHADAYQEPGKHVSRTAWRVGTRLKTGGAMGRSTPRRRMTADRSSGSRMRVLEPDDLPTDGGRAAVRGTRSPRRGCPLSGRRRPGRRGRNAPRRRRRPPATPLHRPSPGR